MKVTDAMIERAAEGMWRSELDDLSPAASAARRAARWSEESPHVRARWGRYAKAALTAALTQSPPADPDAQSGGG